MKISVLGAGTFGTALASLLAKNGHDVVLWSKFESEIIELKKTNKHKNLKGAKLSKKLNIALN